MGERLLNSGLKRLRICIDTINPDVYPHVRTGGDFEKLARLTKAFLEQAKGHALRIEIQKMRSRMTTDESVSDFKRFFDLKSTRTHG